MSNENASRENFVAKSRISFLILQGEDNSLHSLAEALKQKNKEANIIVTQKTGDALNKIRNAMPLALIIDLDAINFATTNIFEVVFSNPALSKLPLIALTEESLGSDKINLPYMETVNLIQKPAKVSDIINFTMNILANKTTGTAKYLKIRPGEYLFRQGDHGRSFYVLQSGKLNVFVPSKEKSTDIKIAEIIRGGVVGEMAFIDGSARSANVIAEQESTLIEVPAKNLDDAIVKNPKMAIALIRTVVGRARDLNLQVADLSEQLQATRNAA